MPVCTSCKKNKEDDGFKVCEKCRTSSRESANMALEYRKLRNRCSRCGAEIIYGKSNMCVDCREHMSSNALRYYYSNKDDILKKRKNRSIELKEKGMCTRCGKPKENKDYAYCSKCKAYCKRHRPKPYLAEWRKQNGLCRWCDNPRVSGNSYCQHHIDILTASGKKQCELRPRTEREKPIYHARKIRYEYDKDRMKILKQNSDTLNLSYFKE